MTVNTPILFVLGPSGAGKTTLGQWLAEDLHFLRIEIDQWPADGIDRANLRPEWNEFWDRCQAGAIASTLRARVLNDGARGAVLTFPSRVVFSVQQLAVLEQAGIRVLVLYGSEDDCLAAFLRREKESGRNLTEEHWRRNSCDTHKLLADSSYAPYRVTVFQAGRFRDRAALVAVVRECVT
jgi:hypothetical protein